MDNAHAEMLVNTLPDDTFVMVVEALRIEAMDRVSDLLNLETDVQADVVRALWLDPEDPGIFDPNCTGALTVIRHPAYPEEMEARRVSFSHDGGTCPVHEAAPAEDEEVAYTHDLIDVNVADLRREVEALERHEGRMVGVVTEEAGGIIAYAIGEDHAGMIVDALTLYVRANASPSVLDPASYVRGAIDAIRAENIDDALTHLGHALVLLSPSLPSASSSPERAKDVALSINSIRSASFRRQGETIVGVAYCGQTGIEYDVRLSGDDVWYVSDDDGRTYEHTILERAILRAIEANTLEGS